MITAWCVRWISSTGRVKSTGWIASMNEAFAVFNRKSGMRPEILVSRQIRFM